MYSNSFMKFTGPQNEKKGYTLIEVQSLTELKASRVGLRQTSIRRETHQGATFAPLWIQQIQQVSRFIHQSVPLASGLGTVLCRLGGTWLVLG